MLLMLTIDLVSCVTHVSMYNTLSSRCIGLDDVLWTDITVVSLADLLFVTLGGRTVIVV